MGQPTHYHTPLDDFASTSPASLQHHADNAMAAVRGLAGAGLARPAAGDAIFFDLFGLRVIAWPEGWELVIAVLALLLVVTAGGLAFRRGLRGRGVGLGLLAFLAALVLSAVAAFVMSLVTQKASPVAWVAHPLPLVAAHWLMPLGVVGLIAASGLGRRAGFLGMWAGVWLAWSLLGLVLVLTGLPKVSYLFAIPALVAGASGLAGLGATAALLPVLVAGALWFPIVAPLYDGLGSGGLLPVALLMTILLAGTAPFFAAAPGRLSRGGRHGGGRARPGPARLGHGRTAVLPRVPSTLDLPSLPGRGERTGALDRPEPVSRVAGGSARGSVRPTAGEPLPLGSEVVACPGRAGPRRSSPSAPIRRAGGHPPEGQAAAAPPRDLVPQGSGSDGVNSRRGGS